MQQKRFLVSKGPTHFSSRMTVLVTTFIDTSFYITVDLFFSLSSFAPFSSEPEVAFCPWVRAPVAFRPQRELFPLILKILEYIPTFNLQDLFWRRI